MFGLKGRCNLLHEVLNCALGLSQLGKQKCREIEWFLLRALCAGVLSGSGRSGAITGHPGAKCAEAATAHDQPLSGRGVPPVIIVRTDWQVMQSERDVLMT